MSESSELPEVQGTDPSTGMTAGALLRQARQAQGLHIAALAAQLKVNQRKLEALESDRYEELQGVAFVRALAQAACRVLKVDAAPVLARLPQVEQRTLDRVSGGLNEPFREKGSHQDVMGVLKAGRGLLLAVAALLVSACLLWLLPPEFSFHSLMGSTAQPAAFPDAKSQPDASDTGAVASAQPAEEAASASPGAAEPGTSQSLVQDEQPASSAAPSPVAASVASAPSVAASSGPLALSTSGASWIEVSDARGEVLLARTMTAGETLSLDPVLPVRLKIGNASVTALRFRGKPVDLSSATRDNVARIELK